MQLIFRVYAVLIISNVVYQICAKSVPKEMNPFASLTITYIVGAIASAVLYFVLGKNGNLIKEYGKLNWAPFVLALMLLVVGYFLYNEAFTWNKVVGVVICLIGLVFINCK